MGIIQADEKHRGALLAFLEEQPLVNTFLLADIQRYGFAQAFQQVWASWEQGGPAAVYLRFYQNLILYSGGRGIDPEFIREAARQHGTLVIMGPGQDMAALAPLADEGWEAVDKGLYGLPNGACLPGADMPALRTAGPQDAGRIHAFLQSIEGFGAMYASRQMIADRIASKDGVHLFLERDGELLAHANSTTASAKGVVLGGVATRPQDRGQGYASAVVAALCRRMLAGGRQPCVFSSAGAGHNLFQRLGFERLGSWHTLERTHIPA